MMKYWVILPAVLLVGCGDSTDKSDGEPHGADGEAGWDGEDGGDREEVVDWEDGGVGDGEADHEDGDGGDSGDSGDAVDTGDTGDTGDYGPANSIWIEIDYSNAYTPQSPGWEVSDTPGFGLADWAPEGWDWPEAWDRYSNMNVIDDRIGTALIIGPGAELQLMIGLEELISYDHAVVRLEGRSYDCCSRVWFDVYNPWNGLGTSGDMAQDWTVHVVELDFDNYLETGSNGGFQAVRVDPTSGSLSLVRMRITIYDPLW